MSEEITPQTDEPTVVDDVTPEPQGEPADATDWKAESRKWEKRAKDANADREAASKWREYEAAQKPENERLAEELATAKNEAESARTTLLRYEVAAEKGIPSEAIRLLNGSTREELEEAAETLSALIAAQSKPNSPRPDESQGRPATVKAGQLTQSDLDGMTSSEIMEARKQGRLDLILGK
jgi:hypothetical protein